jgi:hypothetical protein
VTPLYTHEDGNDSNNNNNSNNNKITSDGDGVEESQCSCINSGDIKW